MDEKILKNEIYCVVDEGFIANFDYRHRDFMKKQYYELYSVFCDHHNRKKLSIDEFFTNMHRRRIYLYQLCCPYCGTVMIFPFDKKIQKEKGMHYCCNCGHSSVIHSILKHISRFKRICNIVDIGLNDWKQKHPDMEEWLLGYDCFQMEIIELASIIEAICREYFEALIFIKNMGLKNDYIRKVISKQAGNDFMNIDKANNHFKKAFGIDLKASLEIKVWNDLIDIVNLRNMIVHNDGRVDDHFKSSASYKRLKENVDHTMYRLEKHMVMEYFESVANAVSSLSFVFIKHYLILRHSAIANYYFNYASKEELNKKVDE